MPYGLIPRRIPGPPEMEGLDSGSRRKLPDILSEIAGGSALIISSLHETGEDLTRERMLR
jgi:hypothetical protein